MPRVAEPQEIKHAPLFVDDVIKTAMRFGNDSTTARQRRCSVLVGRVVVFSYVREVLKKVQEAFCSFVGCVVKRGVAISK